MTHGSAKRRGRRIFAAALLLLLLPSLSGCENPIHSNFRGISTLQLVQTVGIDETKGLFNLTVSTGKSLEGQAAVIISRPGESYITAEAAIQDYTMKEALFFPNARNLLFGEGAAKALVAEVLDYLARGASMRMNMSMFVVKDSTAKELISSSGKKDYDIAEALASIENVTRHQGSPIVFTCREVISRLAEYDSSLVCAVSASKTEGSIFADAGKLLATPYGYGILRGGELCSYLDMDLTIAANILLNRSALYSLVADMENDIKTTFSAESSNAEYHAEWNGDGGLNRIVIEIETFGRLLEMSAPPDSDREAFLSDAEAVLNEMIKTRCAEVVRRSQELEADFLGLKGILRMEHPKQVLALGEDFISALAAAEIEINVKTTISRSYRLEDTDMLIGGGGGK
jgi:spore germination protein KC